MTANPDKTPLFPNFQARVFLKAFEIGFIEGIQFVAVFFGDGRVQTVVDVLEADFVGEFYGSFEVTFPVRRGFVEKK